MVYSQYLELGPFNIRIYESEDIEKVYYDVLDKFFYNSIVPYVDEVNRLKKFMMYAKERFGDTSEIFFDKICDAYWNDIGRVLEIYSKRMGKKVTTVEEWMKEMDVVESEKLTYVDVIKEFEMRHNSFENQIKIIIYELLEEDYIILAGG